MEEMMSASEDIVVMYSTTPPAESAGLARILVEQRLIACVSIVPVRSLYRWNDNVCDEEEHLLIMKTVRANADRVVAMIKEHNSYEVPEVITLPVTGGYLPYLDWIKQETRNNRETLLNE
jgi:periplasmic divalent cation tolerance protein